MKPDYIDASALVSIILEEGVSASVDALLRDRSSPVFVSDFCLAECSSALATFSRGQNHDMTQTERLWLDLDEWVSTFAEHIQTEAEDIGAAISIIRQPDLKLRAPDAIHVATAARLQARLITLDKRMARAATALGVAYINPAEALGEQKD